MATRRVGARRVLGSGPALSPVNPLQNASLLSPSPSTISIQSSSVSAPSSETHDLSSRISLDHGEGPLLAPAIVSAAASTRLACPICNEEMVTLLQLNRHLDDDHKNLEEIKQDEAKDWFKIQMVKAQKFKPLAVLNQKFKGLEVFEANDGTKIAENRAPNGTHASPSATPAPPLPPPANSDEVVTKAHWERHGPDDRCHEPTCGKRLTSANGSINCRHCGKLFCSEHTMYQMKLSRSAQHEPVRGFWCRVCETCYKSREGYNDRHGLIIDHSQEFGRLRGQHVDKTLLDISRLEKRLTKLTQLLTDPSLEDNSTTGILWSLTGTKASRKQIEQSVVDWEDDAAVSRCPFCHQDFSSYIFRRHHCRLCGRVVCADPSTDCSQDVGLTVAAASDMTEKATRSVPIDVRMCKDCRHKIFYRSDFAASITHQPPDVKAYDILLQFERGIRLLLPKFHRLLMVLQDPEKPPSPAQLADASRTRKRLVDAFGQYSTAARRIRDLPTESDSQRKLQQAIYQQSYNFLQIHMLPLKSLPKILKHASVQGTSPAARPLGNGTHSGALAAIKFNELDNASQVSSSSAVSALENEEKSLRESIMVLEEQLFMIKEQVIDANKRRKFDEAASLAHNVEDLSAEIDRLQGQLGQLDFASAYGAAPSFLASPQR